MFSFLDCAIMVPWLQVSDQITLLSLNMEEAGPSTRLTNYELEHNDTNQDNFTKHIISYAFNLHIKIVSCS